jgi:hypothetical protein
MEPQQEGHVKKWWAAIPNSVLLQLLQELVQARGASEKWTESMAHISLKLDFDAQETVSILGYRNQWGWSHERTKKFIENSGLELVKIDESNSRSLSILKSTHNRHTTDTKPTLNRHVKIIDFEDLERGNDTKPTHNRHQTDTEGDTPNNKQDLDLEQLAGLLQNLDPSSQQYVENELRRINPANPVAYARAVISRLDKERSASNENYSGNGNADGWQELSPAHRAALQYLGNL